jgi:UDP-N-acetylmuramoylalanine--D-glutamate ligase
MVDCLDVYDQVDAVAGEYDIALVSPGIAPHTPLYRSAVEHCREVLGDVELGWRIAPERWLAITGTNGKTTTTTLTAHLINQAANGAAGSAAAVAANTMGSAPGHTPTPPAAHVAGNIGVPVFQVIAERQPGDWIVCEASSYELYSTARFRPDAAALLNITPDHVSWHGSLAAYAAAKYRIFAHQPDLCIDLTGHLGERGALPAAARDLAAGANLQIKGPHNLENAEVASALALFAGLTPAQVQAGLESFAPLEHRFEPVATIDGVCYLNDSKATNPEATIVALQAFLTAGTTPDSAKPGQNHLLEKGELSTFNNATPKPVILMAGGRDKLTDLAAMKAVAAQVCDTIICYGEAAERFQHELAGAAPIRRVATFYDAFELAHSLARPGMSVLLSPACASFDEFSCFEERGEVFKQLVREL